MSSVDVFVEVNARDVYDLVDEWEEIYLIAGRSVAHQIKEEARELASKALSLALEEAGFFPSAYAAHLQRSLGHFVPFTQVDYDSVRFEYPGTDGLGDETDIEESFHWHAIDAEYDVWSVSNPVKVDLPGPDQDLYAYVSHSGDRREEYWQAIISGETSFEITLGGKRKQGSGGSYHKVVPIPAGAQEATYIRHVRQWGYRYPEWIMLEYGWDSQPPISPGHFGSHLEELTAIRASELYMLYIDNIIAQLEAKGYMVKSGFRTLGGQYAAYKNISVEELLA